MRKFEDGKTYTVHMCQSVSGAIKNWDKKMWNQIGNDNGMTGDQAKEKFRIMEFNGIKVIPIVERCEGFSDIDGCPGHEKEKSI